ncbi:MAG: hypothetical protein AzoDbin1_05339, partial [Azoarcus sp.]|nr:hypothetical protein [Azoarcus sp.]
MPKGRGDALRAAVLALGRKRRNDRVPAGLRERLVRHAQARRRAGWGWGAIARELGVAGSTLQRWCAPDRGSMRRVRVTRARRPAGTMPGR